jgi:hypothetical protein
MMQDSKILLRKYQRSQMHRANERKIPLLARHAWRVQIWAELVLESKLLGERLRGKIQNIRMANNGLTKASLSRQRGPCCHIITSELVVTVNETKAAFLRPFLRASAKAKQMENNEKLMPGYQKYGPNTGQINLEEQKNQPTLGRKDTI